MSVFRILMEYWDRKQMGQAVFSRHWRTIPVILEIVEDIKLLCPDAWLINFTNPSGMVTEAVLKHSGWERCIGLCNVPVIAMQKEYEAIGYRREDLIYQYAGLNHFHWHKVFDHSGHDITEKLIDAMLSGKDVGLPANIADISFFGTAAADEAASLWLSPLLLSR